MKPPAEWDEEYILALPLGEFDWLEVKGRRAIDLTVPGVNEGPVRKNLAKEISAFANSGGGQLVLGLVNPSGQDRWNIDDGGISTCIRGKTDTREWLEDVIPTLTEHPLAGFNVYAIKPLSTGSQISPGRALYVVDIPDSSQAPHQSTLDHMYYARAGGKSVPLGHRMVADIFGRRQNPKVELEFGISRKLIKGQPRNPLDVNLDWRSRPPEKDTNAYKLVVRARNTGRVFAQYVNAFIKVPVELLPRQEVKLWRAERLEKIDGKEYLRYYKDNTVRDHIRSSGMENEYGPSRYEPILPALSHLWEISLQRDIQDFARPELSILWTVYADNAAQNSGEMRVRDIPITDAAEPDWAAAYDDGE